MHFHSLLCKPHMQQLLRVASSIMAPPCNKYISSHWKDRLLQLHFVAGSAAVAVCAEGNLDFDHVTQEVHQDCHALLTLSLELKPSLQFQLSNSYCAHILFERSPVPYCNLKCCCCAHTCVSPPRDCLQTVTDLHQHLLLLSPSVFSFLLLSSPSAECQYLCLSS
jgi:hypothetical protein